jgi:ketosteroid isomerase-like protein
MRGSTVDWWRSRSIASRDSSGGVRRWCGRLVIVIGAVAPWMVAAEVRGADPSGTGAVPAAADVAAIRAAASAYRASLAKGDMDAVRDAWTADGDIVDGWGNLLSAKEASSIGGGTKAAARPEFRVGETRLRFVTPDVALEDGSVDAILPGTKLPIEGWFTAVWVRQGGGWKLAGVRESERPVAPTADMLEDLDWMVGRWVLVTEGAAAGEATPSMEMTVRWDAGRTFLVREAKLTSREADGEPSVVEMEQRIGWDPAVGRIRSWSFSTDGSRGEATWFRDGDSWVVRGSAVLPDGKQMNSANIYSYDGDAKCVWRTLPEPLASNEGLPTRGTWVRSPARATQ